MFLKIVIEKIGLEQMLENESLSHLAGDEAVLWPPKSTEVACDTAVWLPALKNKKELGKQLLTSGERGLVLGKLDLCHLFVRTCFLC